MFTPNYSYGTQFPAQQQQNTINWVQGEAGAKSFMTAPGQSVLLMDSETNVFYIKSSDASGMPMPLRKFKYEEVTPQKKETGNYITREEFEERIKELMNGKQSVSATEQ
jgi:hypothetical protein